MKNHGKSTREVAHILGCQPQTLSQMVYNNQLEQPLKVGKNYKWSDEQINRASWKINGRPAMTKKQRHYQIIGGNYG